jgi:3-dehydroquinate synthase
MNIILTGFMGTGKSTVGGLLASQLGRFHLDTDEMVEFKTGKSIKNIFEQWGEAYFRQFEKSVVKDICRNERKAVISTGGKTLLDEENFARLSETGLVFTLIDNPHNCWERVRDSFNRPLIKNFDWDGFLALYRQREKLYQSLPNKIQIEGLSLEEVTKKLLGFLSAKTGEFEISHGKQKTVVSMERFIDLKPRALVENNLAKLFVVYDKKVTRALEIKATEEKVFTLPLAATDVNKNLRQAEKIWKWLLVNGVKRDSVLISVGGGVIGDLAGFVSSTILRGIKHFHLPTTLLAMVDSCLGGKNGINYGAFKNSLGTFSLPERVIINPFFLTSLKKLDLSTGLVEAVKAGLIGDAGLVDLIEEKLDLIWKKDIATLEEVIWRALQVKRAIVEEDLYETGNRKKLNLGHTLGHALEAYHDYQISHGQAVAIGLLYSLRLSELLGLVDSSVRERLKKLFSRLDLDMRIHGQKAELLKLMGQDKKTTERGLDFVLFSANSGVILKNNIDKKLMLEAMEEVIDENIDN